MFEQKEVLPPQLEMQKDVIFFEQELQTFLKNFKRDI